MKIQSHSDIDELLTLLDLNQGPWEVNVKKWRNSKSQRQLGWIWASAYPQIQDHWESESGVRHRTEFIHEWNIRTYSRVDPNQIAHQISMYDSVIECADLRLSKMNTKEAAEYQSWLMNFYPTKGLYLNEPR